MKPETLIYDKVRQIIPKGSSKTVFFASVTETSYEVFFYAYIDGNPVQCFELAEQELLDENELDTVFADIVDVISYVLIAFVGISLVVSSIMIGVITYISVLERKKEIGILRAIGASKHNISQVFNAETFIVGLLSGLMGIGITLILLIPTNIIIHNVSNQASINAMLPVSGAIILILLSIGLTLLGGLIPSRKAAKEDPVKEMIIE